MGLRVELIRRCFRAGRARERERESPIFLPPHNRQRGGERGATLPQPVIKRTGHWRLHVIIIVVVVVTLVDATLNGQEGITAADEERQRVCSVLVIPATFLDARKPLLGGGLSNDRE